MAARDDPVSEGTDPVGRCQRKPSGGRGWLSPGNYLRRGSNTRRHCSERVTCLALTGSGCILSFLLDVPQIYTITRTQCCQLKHRNRNYRYYIQDTTFSLPHLFFLFWEGVSTLVQVNRAQFICGTRNTQQEIHINIYTQNYLYTCQKY